MNLISVLHATAKEKKSPTTNYFGSLIWPGEVENSHLLRWWQLVLLWECKTHKPVTCKEVSPYITHQNTPPNPSINFDQFSRFQRQNKSPTVERKKKKKQKQLTSFCLTAITSNRQFCSTVFLFHSQPLTLLWYTLILGSFTLHNISTVQ